MDIFSVFTICGGLAFFLYGMNTMSKSLEKMAGGKLEQLLKVMTSNPLKSMLLGAGITIAIQSSSAMTVMLVGLVNSGVMEFEQTIGVIMGSNIGTTLTAWILSMAGIESGNFFIKLLKPENFSPLIALAGILLIMGSKKQRRRDIGRTLIGFSILMYGMELMKGAVSPLADMPGFSDLLTAFTNPLLGVLVGAAFTGVIQSSAASIGILQALSMTGSINYAMAIPVVMGANIGTCVTSLISSIGVSRSAKRVTAVHVSIKVIGTIFCLIVFYGGNLLIDFTFMRLAANPVGIALCHTIFNVINTVILLPFSRQLIRLATKMIPSSPDEAAKELIAYLDPLLMRTPGVAVAQCVAMTEKMGRLAHETLLMAIAQFDDYQEDRAELIRVNEDKLDIYEDRLGAYLVEISQHGVSMTDIRTVSRLLHAITDFERIGDHSFNLQENALELKEKGLHFSEAAQQELPILINALEDIMTRSLESFIRADATMAVTVEPLEETIDRIIAEIRARHIQRLQSGECTIQMGFILNDLLGNFERVSDHCSNIALSVIEERDTSVDRHAYANDLWMDNRFTNDLEMDLDKYHLPEN